MESIVINFDKSLTIASVQPQAIERAIAAQKIVPVAPEQRWPYRPSISIIREIMDARMYPTTIEGLERTMRGLGKQASTV